MLRATLVLGTEHSSDEKIMAEFVADGDRDALIRTNSHLPPPACSIAVAATLFSSSPFRSSNFNYFNEDIICNSVPICGTYRIGGRIRKL